MKKQYSSLRLKHRRVLHALITTFQRLSIHIYKQSIVTITDINFTYDMRNLYVYVSLLPDEHKGQLLDHLQNNLEKIKKGFYAQIKNQLQYMPELEFRLDDTAMNAQRMQMLLNDLSK